MLRRSIKSRRNARRSLTVASALVGFSSIANAQQLTTFLSPSTNAWSDVLAWNNGIPNGPNFVAIVNGGSSQFTGAGIGGGDSISVLGVRISTNNFVSIQTGGQLTVSGGVADSGIGLNSASLNLRGDFASTGEAVLNVNGTTPVSGAFGNPGFVNMSSSDTGRARIRGSGTLSVGNFTTITGGGDIGQSVIHVVNAGTIEAGAGTQDLIIDVINNGTTAGFFNNGTLIANGTTAGNSLVLSGFAGGSFDNANGRIIAGSTDVRLVTSVDVRNGTLSSSGAGVIRVPFDDGSSLTNVTNLGNVVVNNNAALIMVGTFTNTGSVNVNAGANAAFVRVGNGTVGLAGSGVVNLNSPNAFISRTPFSGDGTFVNNSNIQGQGQVGAGGIYIVNNGVIQATTGTLTIAPISNGATGCINTGTLLANGGVLTIFGPGNGFYDNTGGRIIAGSTDVQLVSSANIRNGTLSSSGAGVIRVANNDGVKLADVTNTGNIVVGNTAVLDLGGTITNNGSINLNPTTNLADLRIPPTTVTLAGSGVINLNGVNARISASAFTIGGTLVNNTTIQGEGQIGTNNIFVVNNGLIQATTGTIYFSPISTGANTMGVINNGTLLANGGSIALYGTLNSFYNTAAGTISVAANGTLLTTNSADIRGGVVDLNGRWNADNSSNSNVTRFRGSGTLNITASARVGLMAGGGTVGTSRVSSLSLATGGRLDLADHDLAIDYTGASPIGSIRPLLAEGYNGGPWNGNTTMITTSAGAAAFATSDKTGIGYAEATDVLGPTPTNFRGVGIDGTTVVLRYTLLGDANLTGTVDIDDFGRLASNFNTPSRWFNGDFNYSGTTDIDDFGLLAANFNKSLAAGPIVAGRLTAVPEPTGALLAAPLLLSRRRARRR